MYTGRLGMLGGVVAGLLLGWLTVVAGLGGPGGLRADNSSELPRFTPEREAAARAFVQKNLPELLPILDQRKKTSAAQYEKEIRAIFHVSELLADLLDEPRRHELELKIWKAENRANTLIARLATPNETERKQIEEQLLGLARELVELDIQIQELRAEQLEKELGEVKDELAKMRETIDKQTEERYKGLLLKVKRPKRNP